MTTYGALFAGYGGLELGVQSVLGGHLSWYAEIDQAPSRVMAHHYPHAPNLGDVTRVDWTTVEPVDVLTGGTPCQDLSHAGNRKGMTDNQRAMYCRSAATTTAVTVVPSERALSRAARHSSSGTRMARAVVLPSPVRAPMSGGDGDGGALVAAQRWVVRGVDEAVHLLRARAAGGDAEARSGRGSDQRGERRGDTQPPGVRGARVAGAGDADRVVVDAHVYTVTHGTTGRKGVFA